MVGQDRGSARRVVVVGSGFGGYGAARALRRPALDVTLLSATDGMLYAPLLPDVAVGAVDPRSAVVPLTGTLGDVTVVRGRAHHVDLERRVVRFTGPDDADHELGYDRLLLAPGGVTRMLDIPGLADHAIGLKTVTEALWLRDHVLGRVELAAVLPAGPTRTAALTFVVVGAGYAGTELTAQMARLTRRLLAERPGLDPADARWLLVDVAEAVMPELGESLGADALALLRRRGVDVRLGVSIESVTDDAVTLTDGARLDCSTVVWCAGVTANPLIATLGLPTVKGRLVVDADLRVPGHPEVYAIGDAAAVPDLTKPVDDDGHRPLCPPTAQHATRQATAAARNIRADLAGDRVTPYTHHDLGLVVDLGGPDAAATPLGIRLKGRPAKVVTRGYHLLAMPTLRRRARVAADWLLTGSRPDDVSFGVVDREEALIARAEGE
ncbi:NAD(P)/FAD-dependent oxidoreductase [Nakamurella deserti]|uniref:NAD(P)/FAD-dependent oxidoreductase n=1 Tax=Nakamurella deserti TaxID=2164074 RepID=UPI000DBEA3E4|nr:FAD-dependent oxidoreductase [Nakamurella deserti]